MKRLFSFISAMLFILITLVAPANAADSDLYINQANNSFKSWDIFLSDTCKGRVDYPHISRHVKGTVNIVASINCPSQFASITAMFFRDPIKSFADIRVGHTRGRDFIKMNLAVPCISNEGLSMHSYYFTGTFVATRHFPVIKTFSWPVPC